MISDVTSVAMDEKMMSKTQQRVIKLITKPHNDRSNPEIDVVLPWLKKKSDVMKGIDDRESDSFTGRNSSCYSFVDLCRLASLCKHGYVLQTS